MNRPTQGHDTRSMIGIIGMTGPLAHVLAALPGDFSWPILFPGIGAAAFKDLAPSLEKRCPLKVVIAEDGDVPEPGKVYLIQSYAHSTIEEGRLRIIPDEAAGKYHQRDEFFGSMARELGADAVAVILSGLGSDGAEGMKAVRDAGGYTIVEDESTSIVYGTPRSACGINAARESLPIHEIGPRLLELATAGGTHSQH